MNPTKISLFLLAAVPFGILAALCWPSGYMTSRDIGCMKVEGARGKEICASVSASMRWTWLGHAIVSPGWRVTSASLREVYCAKRLSAADIPALEGLKKETDWRLQDAADDLLHLLKGAEPEGSIFSPKNPDYILKDGCGASAP